MTKVRSEMGLASCFVYPVSKEVKGNGGMAICAGSNFSDFVSQCVSWEMHDLAFGHCIRCI